MMEVESAVKEQLRGYLIDPYSGKRTASDKRGFLNMRSQSIGHSSQGFTKGPLSAELLREQFA
jgi:hypothetical protein